MDSTDKTPYDEVPYQSSSFPETHPDSLGTIGRLFGIKVAPVESCRLLELGCARGENIIPLAAALPHSEFVGVDFSANQIEFANGIVEQLGLKNIKLLHMNILDIGEEFGHFDYIITHGIYSWVPKNVQDKIISISKLNLASNGVAYISYNTLPGWHLRGVLRDIMLYHAKQYPEPGKYIEQARAFMEFISKTLKGSEAPYAKLIENELSLIRKMPDWFLFHDYLEVINDPVYFYEFMDRASTAGLQYVSDLPFSGMVLENYPSEVRSTLEKISSNLIRMEQYKDFLTNRMFRRTILCHKEQKVTRSLGPESPRDFLVASSLKPASLELDLTGSEEIEFANQSQGKSIRIKDPLVKAAFLHLSFIWPRWVSFDEVHEVSRARAYKRGEAPSFDATAAKLGGALMKGYLSEVIEFHISRPPFTVEITEAPKVTGLARLQASRGGPIVNLRHEPIVLDEIVRNMIAFIDGAKKEIELLEIASKLIDGRKSGKSDKNTVEELPRQEIKPKSLLTEIFNTLSRNAFLVE